MVACGLRKVSPSPTRPSSVWRRTHATLPNCSTWIVSSAVIFMVSVLDGLSVRRHPHPALSRKRERVPEGRALQNPLPLAGEGRVRGRADRASLSGHVPVPFVHAAV